MDEKEKNIGKETDSNIFISLLDDIYKTVLEKKEVSKDIGFLSLGGKSLQAMMLILKIEKETGISIDIQTVYENPCIRELAEILSKNKLKGI